ncbi:unnamed protein product, partial [Prorocentrum cordatum]
ALNQRLDQQQYYQSEHHQHLDYFDEQRRAQQPRDDELKECHLECARQKQQLTDYEHEVAQETPRRTASALKRQEQAAGRALTEKLETEMQHNLQHQLRSGQSVNDEGVHRKEVEDLNRRLHNEMSSFEHRYREVMNENLANAHRQKMQCDEDAHAKEQLFIEHGEVQAQSPDKQRNQFRQLEEWKEHEEQRARGSILIQQQRHHQRHEAFQATLEAEAHRDRVQEEHIEKALQRAKITPDDFDKDIFGGLTRDLRDREGARRRIQHLAEIE